MQFAIVITDQSFDLDDFIKINKGAINFEYSTTLEIVYEDPKNKFSYLSIKKDNTLYLLMEEGQKLLISKTFSSYNIFLFMYFEFENAKQVIGRIPLDIHLLVDNDYGCIMSRDSFMKINNYQEFITIKN